MESICVNLRARACVICVAFWKAGDLEPKICHPERQRGIYSPSLGTIHEDRILDSSPRSG